MKCRQKNVKRGQPKMHTLEVFVTIYQMSFYSILKRGDFFFSVENLDVRWLYNFVLWLEWKQSPIIPLFSRQYHYLNNLFLLIMKVFWISNAATQWLNINNTKQSNFSFIYLSSILLQRYQKFFENNFNSHILLHISKFI